MADKLAGGRGTGRIRVYSDCGALAALWLKQRDDPRLDVVAFGPGNCDALTCALRPRRQNREVDHSARIAARGELALGDE
jgi:hypothetical protein